MLVTSMLGHDEPRNFQEYIVSGVEWSNVSSSAETVLTDRMDD